MKAYKPQFTLLAFLIISLNTQLFSQSPEEFKQRRQDAINKLEPSSALILRSGDASGTFAHPGIGGFFYYLAGINETYSCLVLGGEYTRTITRCVRYLQDITSKDKFISLTS